MSAASGRRILFFGSSSFALPTLDRLAEEADLVAVVTRPARPAGRRQRASETPVAMRSRELGCQPLAPERLDAAELTDSLRSLRPDFGVVVSYGGLLPASLLAVPKHGFWNVHPSLLPRWRGAAPVQRAMLAGDAVTGVSIMQVVASLDSGPVAMQSKTRIRTSETAGELAVRLAALGAKTLSELLRGHLHLTARPQNHALATYAHKLAAEDERIDWRLGAKHVDRQIRALSPRPGAWSRLRDERIRILEAEVRLADGAPGLAMDDRLLIGCGQGALRLRRLQRPGKRILPAEEFLRGCPVTAGTRLE